MPSFINTIVFSSWKGVIAGYFTYLLFLRLALPSTLLFLIGRKVYELNPHDDDKFMTTDTLVVKNYQFSNLSIVSISYYIIKIENVLYAWYCI